MLEDTSSLFDSEREREISPMYGYLQTFPSPDEVNEGSARVCPNRIRPTDRTADQGKHEFRGSIPFLSLLFGFLSHTRLSLRFRRW